MARSYNMSNSNTPKTPGEQPKKTMVDKIKSHWYVIPILLGIGVIASVSVFGVNKYKEHDEDVTITRTWEDIRDVADGSEEASEADDDDTVERGQMYSTDPMKRELDWDALKAVNDEVACWIYIPNTEVDYPVMQVKKWSDNEYYLDHDVYKKSSSAGSIYMPAPVEGYEDRDMHQLIIGHHFSRNNSMFSCLVNYKDKSYWEVAPYIYLYYPDRVEKWLIYSTFHTTQEDIAYNMPYEASTTLYKELLDHIETSKEYDTATNGPTVTAKCLTLTTCDRNSTDGSRGRFLVNAKLVDTVASDGSDTTAMSSTSSVSNEETPVGENVPAESENIDDATDENSSADASTGSASN